MMRAEERSSCRFQDKLLFISGLVMTLGITGVGKAKSLLSCCGAAQLI